MYKKVNAPKNSYRLIPTKYPPIQTFDDIATHQDLMKLIELEGWTNDRLVRERLTRLPQEQWLFGVPNSSIVMAAFLHGAESGLRFSGRHLGAWYCSLNQATAIAEVAVHLRREARNCNFKEMRVSYRSYNARLRGEYLDIRNKHKELSKIYSKTSYLDSQEFAEQHRSNNEDGIIYNSVRYEGGQNIVAFKPKQITAVTIATTFDIIVPANGKIIAMELS